MQRQRKTKDPCPGCFLHKERCICHVIPYLDLKTKVSLIVHTKELKRTTNTGRLAVKALKNSAMYERGKAHKSLDLSELLSEDYETFMFYPAPDAQELTREYIQNFSKPVHLIVPDGNWRQASKVHTRHKELAHLPRVMIKQSNKSEYYLRAESTDEGMATLQAIAHALQVLEGEEAFQSLIGLYHSKLKATMIGRGQKI